jgi:hypothetical protein
MIMQEMGYFEAQEKYNHEHWGNSDMEIGAVVWIKAHDDQGLHEFPVRVVEPSKDEINDEYKRLKEKIENDILCESEKSRAEFQKTEILVDVAEFSSFDQEKGEELQAMIDDEPGSCDFEAEANTNYMNEAI